MKTAEIFVMLPFEEEHKRRLAEAAPGSRIIYGKNPDEGLGAEIIVGQFPPERLGEAKNLRFLQLSFAAQDRHVEPGRLPGHECRRIADERASTTPLRRAEPGE